jgi:uncharacterized protein (TIGR02246 family)
VEDKKERVIGLYKKYIDGWNRRDAQAMAKLVTEDALIIGYDGSIMKGAKELEAVIAQIFKDHPTGEFIAIVKEVQFLNPTTAILRAIVGMLPRGYKDINPSVNAHQVMTAVEINGEFKMAHFQNTPTAFHGRPEEAAKITNELRQYLKSQGLT